jgi:sulfatase modifying factor 1
MRRGAVIVLVMAWGCGTADDPAPADPGTSGAGGIAMGGHGGSGGTPAGTATGVGGAEAPPDGSWEHPFLVDALPFADDGDTTRAVSDVADAYPPCAPDIDESGPEVVYRVEIEEVGWLWASVASDDAVDVDVHLLRDAAPEGCVTRAHLELGAPVQPGSYWIAVDSWVDAEGVALAGPYHLEVGFVGDVGDDCYEAPITCDDTLAPYVNGVPVEEPGDAGCPAGMARVEDFCIDRHEAMIVEVLPDDSLVPFSPYAHPAGVDIMALSVPGTVPQGHISQIESAQACERAGKRLCLDAEWLRACRGAASHIYPYGDTRVPGQCNDARDCHPVIQYFGTDASWVWSELDHPCISQLPEGLALTGANEGCVSDEGVFDLMGNLHEWTADPAGTFRGGFYVDTAINGEGCLYATTAHSVGHWDYSTGFRCCADPL